MSLRRTPHLYQPSSSTWQHAVYRAVSTTAPSPGLRLGFFSARWIFVCTDALKLVVTYNSAAKLQIDH